MSFSSKTVRLREHAEQMRRGTTDVRAALGDSGDISDRQIQDALWHYYYDVGKSVAYLKSMFLDCSEGKREINKL